MAINRNMKERNELIYSWTEAFKDRKFKATFLISLFIIVVIIVFYTKFLNFVENREGFSFDDPILIRFNPIDLTWIIFSLLYAALLWGIFKLIRLPAALTETIQVYTVMMIFRIFAMYLAPFEPPITMIPLKDPFVEFFGTGQLLTKDLFFSGHTATMLILFLTAESRRDKILFFLITIAIAVLVLVQHVHYTIDVIAAFPFTYCSYAFVKRINTKIG